MNTTDNWDHSNDNMRCATCLWSHKKTDGTLRCRAHAPTIRGFPVMFPTDWCGEHKLDGSKLQGITVELDGEKVAKVVEEAQAIGKLKLKL